MTIYLNDDEFLKIYKVNEIDRNGNIIPEGLESDFSLKCRVGINGLLTITREGTRGIACYSSN